MIPSEAFIFLVAFCGSMEINLCLDKPPKCCPHIVEQDGRLVLVERIASGCRTIDLPLGEL